MNMATSHSFQPGDTVRCVDVAGLHDVLELDKIYTVVECRRLGFVRLEGMGLSYFNTKL